MRIKLAVAALLLGWLGQFADADGLFQVDTSTHYIFPLHSGGTNWSLLVTYEQDKYSLDAPPLLRESSTRPRGEPLPSEAVQLELKEAGAGHKVLEIKPLKEAEFQAVGDYHLVVELRGTTHDAPPKLVSQLITVTVSRPEFDLNVDHIAGKSVTIYRALPWRSAAGQVPYVLEIAKPSESAEVVLSTRPVERLKETGSVLEGAVVAVDRTPVEVRTTAPGSATVALSKFREAGDFATSIRFASDAMSKPLSAPLTIHVKDRLTFPLLAILLGVAAGAWVSFATTTRRATLQARYNIAQLRLRLQLIAPAIMSATRAAQYQQITAQVNDAERAIELGRKPPVDPAAIATNLTALEADLSQLQAAVAGRLSALLKQIAAEKIDLLDWVSDIAQRLAPVEAQVRAAGAMNAAGRIEYASSESDQCSNLLDQVSRRAENSLLTAITLAINANATAAADPVVRQQLTTLNAQIGGPYPAFQSALQALRLSLPSGAMALARAASAATYAPPYSINVINKDEPRSGDSIQLQLVCAAGAGVPDQLVWNFGDGRIVTVNKSLTVAQTYAWPNTYQVSVQLYDSDNAAFHESADTTLQVTPGPAVKQILRDAFALKANEWVLTALAVLVATLTGVLALYVDKPFGTLTDYVCAIIWGLGIEKSVHGFGSVYSAINGKS